MSSEIGDVIQLVLKPFVCGRSHTLMEFFFFYPFFKTRFAPSHFLSTTKRFYRSIVMYKFV